ncbi:hypothetical protein BJY04DRAFT_230498 [Aspergillus karnatakaensis]|uniref:ribosomal lysine N-methyltransferase n=1 Tax=Aspergillus karnatakaensis TaxID=1810916 RepID=UPI003CCE3A75
MWSSTNFSDFGAFQRQSDEFASWLASRNGVRVNNKIRIADLRANAAGRGVGTFLRLHEFSLVSAVCRWQFKSNLLAVIVAQADIIEGEELFTIPRALVLSTHNSNLQSRLSQNLGELGPWLSLMLVMIYEYLQRDNSTWAPYFRVLPHNFDTLMFWSPEELAELQGSAVVEKIGREGAEASILETIIPIVRAHPQVFPPIDGLASFEGDMGAQVLLNLAHIMGSLIMAYAFDVEKPENEDERDGEDGYLTDDEDEQTSKGMVPLADILNADADRNNARLFQEEESLVMKAIKPIHAGEEIFNDYGEIPRADLLRRYGYVTDNYTPYDVVELSLDLFCSCAGLSNSDIESQPRLQFLENLELLDDGYAIPRPSADESLLDIIPEELAVLLKTLTLTPEQFTHQEQKQKPPKLTFGKDEARVLLDTVVKSQQRYNTTIQEDHELLAQINQLEASSPLGGSSRRRKMAVQVRLGEKEILEFLKLKLSEHIASAETNPSSKRTANGDVDDSRRTKAQKN